MNPKTKTSKAAMKRMSGLIKTMDELQLRNLLASIKTTLVIEEGFESEEVLDLVKDIFNKAKV